MKSQPRAHLFKRKNNEFFVASHLPVTINLGFLQVYVRHMQQSLHSRDKFFEIYTEKNVDQHPPKNAKCT